MREPTPARIDAVEMRRSRGALADSDMRMAYPRPEAPTASIASRVAVSAVRPIKTTKVRKWDACANRGRAVEMRVIDRRNNRPRPNNAKKYNTNAACTPPTNSYDATTKWHTVRGRSAAWRCACVMFRGSSTDSTSTDDGSRAATRFAPSFE